MDKLDKLGPVEWLKSSNFVLETKVAELNQNQMDQMLCENFILLWK